MSAIFPDSMRWASPEQKQAYLGQQFDAVSKAHAEEQAAKDNPPPKAHEGIFTPAPPEGAQITRLMVQQALHKADSAAGHGAFHSKEWGALYDAVTLFAVDDKLHSPLNQAIARLCIPLPGACRIVDHVGAILTEGRKPDALNVDILDMRSMLQDVQKCYLQALHVAGGQTLVVEFIGSVSGHQVVPDQFPAEIRSCVPNKDAAAVLVHTGEFLKDAWPATQQLLEHVRSTSELADSATRADQALDLRLKRERAQRAIEETPEDVARHHSDGYVGSRESFVDLYGHGPEETE